MRRQAIRASQRFLRPPTGRLVRVNPWSHPHERRSCCSCSTLSAASVLPKTHEETVRNSAAGHHSHSPPASSGSRRSWSSSSSSYAPSSSSTSIPTPFDRPLKVLQRANAARGQLRRATRKRETPLRMQREKEGDDDDDYEYDYWRIEMARRLVDRLQDVAYHEQRSDGFPLALDVGSGPGFIRRALCEGFDDENDDNNNNNESEELGEGAIGGVRKLVQLEASGDWLHRDDDRVVPGGRRCEPYRLLCDEDPGTARWPFPDGTFDLVVSSGSLHWVNDLPALFSEARRVLKPDGCLLCNFVGGDSLPELRTVLALAELEREGGMSSHVGPFVPLPEVGGLLQRAGFALPTLDVDTVQLSYPNAAVLMEHLQRMGESHAGRNRRSRTPLDVLLAASCLYDGLYSVTDASNEPPEVVATLQIIYAIGWTPHHSQPQAKERGSAQQKLAGSVRELREDTPRDMTGSARIR